MSSQPTPPLRPGTGPTQQASPSPSTITPLQQVQFTVDDFTKPERIAFVNSQFQTMQTLVNQLIGATGPTVLPAGIDVSGATVSGLAAPVGPSDAVNNAHVQNNYGAGAIGPQLDVGGTHALKGLNAAYALSSQNASTVAALAKLLPTYVSGNSLQVGGLTFKWGHTGVITTTLAVVFPVAFSTACFAVMLTDDIAGGTGRIMSLSAAPTATGFTVHSTGTDDGSYWLAVGY